MKRSLFSYVVVAMALLFGCVASAGAQTKEAKKDAKKRVKELKKEGWKLMTSTYSMEYVILEYNSYMAEDPENRIALTGIAIGQNPKVGRDNATMNAVTNYAGRAASQVVGKMKSIAQSTASEVSDEIDKFGEAYEIGVNTKITGIVKQHFILYRDLGDGTYEYNVYLSIDESQARQLREEAAQQAAEQAKLKSLSQEVEDFIGQPVEADY